MICVGIDVAKDKHDCFILSSEGKVLADVFTIPNNAEGFEVLLHTIQSVSSPSDKIKVGLEAKFMVNVPLLLEQLEKKSKGYISDDKAENRV